MCMIDYVCNGMFVYGVYPYICIYITVCSCMSVCAFIQMYNYVDVSVYMCICVNKRSLNVYVCIGVYV